MVLGGRQSEVRVESMVLGGERRLLYAWTKYTNLSDMIQVNNYFRNNTAFLAKNLKLYFQLNIQKEKNI